MSLSAKDGGSDRGPRRRKVLDGVGFTVERGEVFGIIGPSGAGKTTLLRLLNDLQPPDEGVVLLDGEDISTLDVLSVRRRVGMVFQTPSLFSGTVGDNVAYVYRLAGMSRDDCEARGRGCLARAGLATSFWERPAAELSQGEQQRVSIARAIAAEPEVLLMDEPTAALDPTSSGRILSLVSSLNSDTGVTIVFVSHLMEQARRLCHRALLLVDGRVVEAGDVETMFSSPASELTRRFVEGTMDVCGDAEEGAE